jgi:tRNA A37 threonylcarbamoyladenosine dehydratase
MKKLNITVDNKEYIVKKYCDYVLSNMDDFEIYSELKNYFYKEKISYPIITLTDEINRYCPQILEDHMVQDVFGKSKEFSS